MATIRDTARLAGVSAAFGQLSPFDSHDVDGSLPGWIADAARRRDFMHHRGVSRPLRQCTDKKNHQDAANESLAQ